MPLYKTITVNSDTQVYIWKIEETLEELSKETALNSFCQKKYNRLKSNDQRKRFMSIRQLLKQAGYTDFDLYYDNTGKPQLRDNRHISITHSFNFSGIIVSSSLVGIDIEKQRDKLLKVAPKFTPLHEYNTLANDEALIRKLAIVWSAKEAIYKIVNLPGLSFIKHISIKDFEFEEQQTAAIVSHKNKFLKFRIIFFEFERFSCAYVLSSAPVEQ